MNEPSGAASSDAPPHYAIGTLVGVHSIPGWFGRVAGAMSTVLFPGGIYPVEHSDTNGDPEVVWWRAADLIRQPIN